MSESGHSQPGLYGIERRRRWKEPGSGGPQNLSGPGGRERDYIAPWERERRVSVLTQEQHSRVPFVPQVFTEHRRVSGFNLGAEDGSELSDCPRGVGRRRAVMGLF